MLIKLKQILNTYTDGELFEIDLWVNSFSSVENIIIDENAIDLITSEVEVKVDGLITKEKYEQAGDDKP